MTGHKTHRMGLGIMRAMAIADDLLQLIESRLAGARPRVAALHLPPSPWNGTKDGEFGAVALDSGAIGLSYVLLDNALATLVNDARGHARRLVGSDALALARRWRDGIGAERTLGFAAVNALSRHILDSAGLVPPDATDSIGGLDPQAGEHIGMVGFFPPLARQVTARGAQLTVLELRADLTGTHPGFDVTLDPSALRHCNKLLMTSTVLLNDTLDAVLAHCRQARCIAMIGPGAGCLPEPLFARGVTAVAGTWIENAAGFADALGRGAPWGRFARKVVWQR